MTLLGLLYGSIFRSLCVATFIDFARIARPFIAAIRGRDGRHLARHDKKPGLKSLDQKNE
jgi:hypothetical protein